MSDHDEPETFDFELVKAETDRAKLYVIDGEEVWFPKSELEEDEQHSTVTVPHWVAKDRGLV